MGWFESQSQTTSKASPPLWLGMRMVSCQSGSLAVPDPPSLFSEYLIFPFLPSLRSAVIQKCPSRLNNLTGKESYNHPVCLADSHPKNPCPVGLWSRSCPPRVSPVCSLMSRHCPVGTGAVEAKQRGLRTGQPSPLNKPSTLAWPQWEWGQLQGPAQGHTLGTLGTCSQRVWDGLRGTNVPKALFSGQETWGPLQDLGENSMEGFCPFPEEVAQAKLLLSSF